MQDEFDTKKLDLQKNDDGTDIVAGGMLVEDLEGEIGGELSERDEDTIGGGVLSEPGRNPEVGDRVELGPLTIDVVEVERNRVQIVRVTVAQPVPVPDAG